jgi:hypothetical protein
VFLLVNYGVDRYNLFYGYKPSKIKPDIFSFAIHFITFCLMIEQVTLLVYLVVRSPKNLPMLSPLVCVSLFIIVLRSVIWIGAMFFQSLSRLRRGQQQ